MVECLPYKQKVTGSNPVLPNLNLGLSSNGLRRNLSKFDMRVRLLLGLLTTYILYFKAILQYRIVGYLGLEPRTSRLKAEYSTIELVTLIKL